MDWEGAIEWNRQALTRILAAIVAMAGLAGGDQPGMLPRHLHRAVQRLLRPAEAATRRLIIAAARGIVVTPPRPRPRKPEPETMEPLLRSLGIAVVMSRADIEAAAAARRAAARRAALRAARSRTLSLPLLDPLRLLRRDRIRQMICLADSEPYELPSGGSTDGSFDCGTLDANRATSPVSFIPLARQAVRRAV
jgi:hypothetical protein